MPSKPQHIAMRQLIRRLASTPNGYACSDAKGQPGAHYHSQHTARMEAAGDLIRVKVPGHYLRFVANPEQADALRAALLAGPPKKMRQPKHAPGAPSAIRTGTLRALILSESAKPGGVARKDCLHIESAGQSFDKCIQRLVQQGLIFRGKVPGWPLRHFASAEGAAAWEAITSRRVRKPKQPKPLKAKTAKSDPLGQAIREKAATPGGFAIADRPTETEFRTAHNRCDRMVKAGLLFRARVYPRTVRFFTTAEARDAFTAKSPSKPTPPRPQPLRQIVIRKPYSPPAPKANAVAVHTANTRYSVHPFRDLRAVSVPMVRVGSAQWRAGVGA